MLEIQKLFAEKSDEKVIEYLQNELHIDIRRENGFSCFNYSQTDSPKTHPIVKECRGLILRDGDWSVALLPFKRFLNYSEGGADEIDFSKAYIQEKVDGSLLSVWHDGNEWQIATRKFMFGNNISESFLLNTGKTFRQLFLDTIGGVQVFKKLNPLFTYTFELCTVHNRVVKLYEKDTIFLLSIRDRETLLEFDQNVVRAVASELGVPVPQLYKFEGTVTPQQLIETLEKFPAQDEGYVVCERDHVSGIIKRVKLKNPRYVILSHARSSLSTRSFIELIFSGEIEELLSYFPQYKENVQEIIRVFYEFLATQAYNGYMLLSKNLETRKDNALFIKDLKLPTPFFFQLLDNPNLSAREFWVEMSKKNVDRFIKDVGLKETVKENEQTDLSMSTS